MIRAGERREWNLDVIGAAHPGIDRRGRGRRRSDDGRVLLVGIGGLHWGRAQILRDERID